MGFQEQLEAHTTNRWTLARICAEMTPDDLAAFQAALADPRSSPTAIARALAATGYKVGESSVARWCKEARNG